jgi:hypothetical protein
MTGSGDSSVVPYLEALLSAARPGQRISPSTLRLLFSRRRWDTSQQAVRSLYHLLGDDRALQSFLEDSPEMNGRFFRGSDGNTYLRRLHRDERETVYIDVNNLVWSFNSSAPRIEPLLGVFNGLRRYGIRRIHAVADANLPYLIADPTNLPVVVEGADAWEYVESGTVADLRIIELCRNHPGWIGSNDRFREWKKCDGWTRANLWRIVVAVTFVPPDGCSLGMVGEELLCP